MRRQTANRLPSVCTNLAVISMVVAVVLLASASARAEDSPPAPRHVCTWGELGARPGEFNFPIGIAINPADEVFVTDFYNARVQQFAADGKFVNQFGVAHFPGGLAIDPEGHIYVAHGGIPPSKFDEPRKRDKIAVYSPDGKLVRDWGEHGTGPGQFDSPGGIAISPDGQVFVADQCNRRVQVFDAKGKFLRQWGRKGFEPGEFGGNPHPKAFFAGPTWLALDRTGQVFTTEAILCRVQTFSPDGKPVAAWGDKDLGPGKFGDLFTAFGHGNMKGPSGICFDAQGRLWANSIGGRVQQFTPEGKFLRGFGEEGTRPGQFYAPHGLAIDRRGNLYIVDAFNHRIQKFAVE